MTTHPLDFDTSRRRARVAYEVARLRVGAIRAAALTAIVGAAALLSFGKAGLAWLPVTALAWTAIEWRGGALLRGGRVGAAVGLVALAMPLWAFRTCCHAGDRMMGAGCCNMTSACTIVGIALGLALAVFLVRLPRETRGETTIGMSLALLAVASVRCAGLFAGEALGLMGGLAAGAVASSLVAALLNRARRAAVQR